MRHWLSLLNVRLALLTTALRHEYLQMRTCDTVYDYIMYNNHLFVRRPLSCALYDADCLVSTVYRILMTLVRWYEGMYV